MIHVSSVENLPMVLTALADSQMSAPSSAPSSTVSSSPSQSSHLGLEGDSLFGALASAHRSLLGQISDLCGTSAYTMNSAVVALKYRFQRKHEVYKKLMRLDCAVRFLRHLRDTPMALDTLRADVDALVGSSTASLECVQSQSPVEQNEQLVLPCDAGPHVAPEAVLPPSVAEDVPRGPSDLAASQPEPIQTQKVTSTPTLTVEPTVAARESADTLSVSAEPVGLLPPMATEDGTICLQVASFEPCGSNKQKNESSTDVMHQLISGDMAATLINEQLSQLLLIVTTAREAGVPEDNATMLAALKQIEDLRIWRNSLRGRCITGSAFFTSLRSICNRGGGSSSNG